MDTYNLNKKCEVCETQVPDSFGNLLCFKCYDNQVKEIELRKKEEEEEKTTINAESGERASSLTRSVDSSVELNVPVDSSILSLSAYNVNGITDPNYQENPEVEDKDQVIANWVQFQKTGVFLWHVTRDMYEWIKNQGMERARSHSQFPKYVWKPQIVDVGCGSGVGSNILSQEADFVWGIDKNKMSIDFAKNCFTRIKNNIYYCPQVSFDQIDIINDTREFMKFDYVVAIEVIEHIYDYKKFLTQLINKFDRRDPRNLTEYFISTPNRANRHLGQDRPINSYHVREWCQFEYYTILKEYFDKVELFNSKGIPIPKEEYRTTIHTPIIARTSSPKV